MLIMFGAQIGLAAIGFLVGALTPKPSRVRERAEVRCLCLIVAGAFLLGCGLASGTLWLTGLGSTTLLASAVIFSWLLRAKAGGGGGGGDWPCPLGPQDWDHFDKLREEWGWSHKPSQQPERLSAR